MQPLFLLNPHFNPLDDPNIRKEVYIKISRALTGDRSLLLKFKKYFDPVDLEILRNYAKRDRIERIVHSSNYMVIYLKRNVINHRAIVIGYDRTRGKLFVNLVDRLVEIYDHEKDELKDQAVRERIFGYDVDVDQDECVISADQVVNYRVQGDLVVSVAPLLDQDVLETYSNMIIHSNAFYQSYARYVIFKVHRLLSSLRIHHTIDNNRNTIMIDRTLYKYSKSFSISMKKFVTLLKQLICDHIGDLCETVHINDRVIDGWGNQYKRIEITVNNVNYNSGLVSEIKKLIMENIKKEKYAIYHGNHRIEIDQAYPRSIRITYDDHEFAAWLELIFVDQETTITITHDQHGKVVIKFDRPYSIQFRSTNAMWDHDLVYTFYVIKRLLQECKQ